MIKQRLGYTHLNELPINKLTALTLLVLEINCLIDTGKYDNITLKNMAGLGSNLAYSIDVSQTFYQVCMQGLTPLPLWSQAIPCNSFTWCLPALPVVVPPLVHQ